MDNKNNITSIEEYNENARKAGIEKAKKINRNFKSIEEDQKENIKLKSKAAAFLKKEIALVAETFLQDFLIDVLNKAPQSFQDNEEAQKRAQKEVQLIDKLYKERGAAKEFIYVVLTSIMIKDILEKEKEFDGTPYHLLHRIAVQFFVKESDIDLSKIPTAVLGNLFRLVESIGEVAPSEALAPKVGSAEYEIAMLLITLKTIESLDE